MILTTSAAAGQYSKVFSADLHLYLAQDSHTSMIADTQVEKLHNKGKKYLKSIQEMYKKSRLVNNLMWGLKIGIFFENGISMKYLKVWKTLRKQSDKKLSYLSNLQYNNSISSQKTLFTTDNHANELL